MVCARILGYLPLYAPSQRALSEVVKAIQTHSCITGLENSRNSKLLELGACFQNMFICSCKLLALFSNWRFNHDQSGNSEEGARSYQAIRAALHPR